VIKSISSILSPIITLPSYAPKAIPWIGLALATIAAGAYAYRRYHSAYEAPNDGFDIWTELPTELVHVIFTHLETDKRLECRRVCKAWKDAFSIDSNYLPAFIDIRTVPELVKIDYQDPNASAKAKLAYRDFRAVVRIVGGWERYENLPEFTGDDDHPDSSQLPAALVRGKNTNGSHRILFRHINTENGKPQVGFIAEKSSGNGWYIYLSGGPVPRIEARNGVWHPSCPNEIVSRIPTPMEFLRVLLCRPAATEASIQRKQVPWTTIVMPDVYDNTRNYSMKFVLWDGPAKNIPNFFNAINMEDWKVQVLQARGIF